MSIGETGHHKSIPKQDVLSDEARLAALGYKQEFKREFSALATCSFAFSIMGVINTISSVLFYPLAAGGHAALAWSWPVTSFFVMFVALSLAELVSSMPTAGGLYFWASHLAPPRSRALICWLTGWINTIGQVSLVCSIAFGGASMIAAFIQVATDDSIILDSRQIYGICLVILVVYGLISGLATSIIARLQVYFATVNILSSIAIVIALVVTASNKGNVVPAKTAFFEFTNNISWLNSPGFTFLISTTGPLWCLTGYDSAAHISEESSNASTAAPRAIIYAVSAMGVLGWATMLAISFVTTDVTSVVNSTLPLPMAQILLDNMGKKGMLAAWFFVTLTQIVGGIPQCIDASRAVYAFSRDGALPLSRYWRRLNPKTLTPIHAVWFVVFSSAVLGLLALVNLTAVEAIFNCAALALYISYAIPILMRITYGRKTFQPGPFSLGSFSVPIGTVACCFVLVQIPVQLFPLGPVTNPLDMNYAVVVLGTILIGSLGWFFLGARRWFQGPRLTILEGSSTAMEINCDNEKIRKEMENEITWTAGQAV